MAYQYITHRPIYEELLNKHSKKSWNEGEILKWCQQVETIYIADPDSMWKYLGVELNVVGGKVLLPDNMYRLLDVYDRDDDKTRVSYNRMGVVLKQLIDYDKDTIKVNYIGTPINDDCVPLIKEEHWAACETFCKINAFEEDMLYQQINPNVYFDWKRRFDGMIQAAKGDYRNWDARDFASMTVIMGNEIPRIGFMPLANNAQKDLEDGLNRIS